MEVTNRFCLYKTVVAFICIVLAAPFTCDGIEFNDDETILVIRPEGQNYEQAYQAFRTEVQIDFPIEQMIVDENSDTKDVFFKIGTVNPKLVVLMDNLSIYLYQQYLDTVDSLPIPSISLMAVFVDKELEKLKRAVGIRYEVPMVLSMISLRRVLNKSINRIGVIYAQWMRPMIEKNEAHCRREGINLVKFEISEKGSVKKELKRAIKQMKKWDIDAMWIPNDSTLINAKTFKSVWMPFAKRFRPPICVGVESLVQPGTQFGSFAAIPDNTEMGIQLADLLYELKGNDWVILQNKAYEPRSVNKILNFRKMAKYHQISMKNLARIDKVFK